MVEKASSTKARRVEFLEELKAEISNPLHRRVVKAYQGDNPVQAMELELGAILLEVLKRED